MFIIYYWYELRRSTPSWLRRQETGQVSLRTFAFRRIPVRSPRIIGENGDVAMSGRDYGQEHTLTRGKSK